jgi:PAS domain S-box-containing protein
MRDSPIDARRTDAVAVYLRWISRWSGFAVCLVGTVVLLGWVFGPGPIRSFLADHVHAKPITALALILAGIAQRLSHTARHPFVRRGLIVGVTLISGATLLGSILDRDLGVERFLFRQAPGPGESPIFPGRMSLITTIECLLFAATLELQARNRPGAGRWAGWTALAGLSVGFTVLLGYTFGAHGLFALGWETGIALPTALVFTLLFAGALASHPETGLMSALVSRGAGGVLLRRLLPFAVAGPWLIGWLSVEGSNRGFYSTHVDQVSVVLPLVFLFVAFLYQSARVLDRLGEEREQRKREVEAINLELEARVYQRTQELLAANEQVGAASRYARDLIEASLDPLVTISKTGKVMDVNHATELVTGRTRQELIGSDFCAYFTDPAEARRGYEQVFEVGLVRNYPLAIRHGHGTVTDVLYNATVFRNQMGEVEGVFAAARDITERKRAELELRRLNRALRALSRCTQAVARAEAEETLLRNVCEIVVQDGGYPLAWVGYTENDDEKTVRPVAVAGLGANYVRNARITWADTERGRGPTGTAIRSGAPCYIPEITLDPRFGPWREAALHHGYASALAIPLQEAGRSFGALNIYAPEAHAFEGEEHSLMLELAATLAHGILALRAHEERDRAAGELRELNENLERRVAQRTAELALSAEEMESFTYSVSHDLRAPLRHIDGFSKVLLETCGGQLDDVGRHYLERVRNGTQQMGRLVDDLLNLSRLGRCPLQVQPTSLGPLVQALVDEMQPETAGRNVEWRVGALPTVPCDRGLMRQVLWNLLSNALKFTRGREPAIIEVGTKGDELYVRDNGVGFDPQYAGKLFGAFQRLHRPEDFPGTGVGLATVRRILRKHGGDIRVEAALDAGATFYFTLSQAETASGCAPTEECHAA